MNRQSDIMRKLSWVVLSAILCQGCTSYHTFEMGKSSELVAEINEKAEIKSADIIMLDGDRHSVINLYFQPDSSHWYSENEVTWMNYSNTDINYIVFVDGKKGAWDGLKIGSGLGLLFGITICTLMSFVMPGDCVDGCAYKYPFDCALKAGSIMAVIGGLIGIPIGGIVGHTDIYTISQQKRNGNQSP